MIRRSDSPIWESSNRPLYPKCVWLECSQLGVPFHRHFIIDSDTSVNRNIPDQVSEKPNRNYRPHYEYIEREDLQLIGHAESPKMKNNQFKTLSPSPDNQKLCCISPSGLIEKDVKMIKQKLKETFNPKKEFEQPKIEIAPSEPPETHNKLTERVLQWLDLAGKQTMVRSETEEIKKPIAPRRVFTAEAIKKPTKNSAIRKTESVHHLSLMLNDEDSYEHRNNLKFSEFYPNQYKTSKKFLERIHRDPSISSNSTANGKPDMNVNKISTNSNGSTVHSKRTRGRSHKYPANNRHTKNEFENQYKDIIERQLVKKNCNTQQVKRQLHIFMPDLPGGKLGVSQENPTDCDSCLSTILSSNISKT